ncbi:hypothetical protein ACFRLW_05545 [Streptomyces sp. NPDC056728]|uniref:hypothetical protein n=1 Tax=Paenibacillus chitinolyticus TaxID=79263 RepID=UPI00366B17B7
MADQMPYPYYRLTATGRDETGFILTLRVEEGAGGPLPGQTTESVLDGIRTLLASGETDVTTSLSHSEITTTYDL